MAVPTSYKKPRKLNFVTLLMVLAAIALAYAAVQFLPPYYRKWQAKGVLSESANAIYPRRFLSGTGASEFLDSIRVRTIGRLRNEVGIDDPGLTVQVTKDQQNASVSADYRERINHPFVGRTTVLHFRPWAQIDLRSGLEPGK